MAKRPTHITPAAARASQAPLDKNIVDIEELIAKSPGGKAAERAYLNSIQPEIDKVARESAERRKLESTAEQQKRATIEKRKREKLAVVAAALEQDRAAERPPDSEPTPERKAKLLGVEQRAVPIKDKDTRANTKVDWAHGVVEFYAGKWSYEQMQGARHLVEKWNETGIEPRITANYDGTPVTAAMFGPRSGGLAGRKRDAYTEWMEIEAITKAHFFEGGWKLIQWFVIETVRVAKEGATMTDQLTEAGRQLAPFVKDKERAWGVAIGSLQRLFEFTYGHFVVPKAMERDRASKHGNYRERLNAKGMGAEQLQREVDEEIAATPKGLHVVKGGK